MNEKNFAHQLIKGAERVKISVFAERKRKLFADLSGTVLEIGPGAGVNFQYYPKSIRWIGAEPNIGFHPHLEKKLEQCGFLEWRLEASGAERLPAADGSMDAVISTQVLCSVSDETKALSEIVRVLKPGGKFYFLEHVVAPEGTFLRFWQNLINPWQKWRGCGCNVNRDTLVAIKASGLRDVLSESFTIGRFFPEPTIVGTAQKL